jgi:hypothetical protein
MVISGQHRHQPGTGGGGSSSSPLLRPVLRRPGVGATSVWSPLLRWPGVGGDGSPALAAGEEEQEEEEEEEEEEEVGGGGRWRRRRVRKVSWSRQTHSPPPSRVRLHRRARQLSDERVAHS